MTSLNKSIQRAVTNSLITIFQYGLTSFMLRAWSIRNPNAGFDVEFVETNSIDLITLKLKSETVKSASKQVSRFRVLFTMPLVLTIDTSINFYCICETV